MNARMAQGLQFLERVAEGQGRFDRQLLYHTTLMGLEACLHGRFEQYNLQPHAHQGEALLNELLINGLLPLDLAESMRDFMARGSVHEATPTALPWTEAEIRGQAKQFLDAFQLLRDLG
jgi:hypothetical protein